MAEKRKIDWLYLAVIGIMLAGMVVLDLRHFYPESLWREPSSPLHFLVTIRQKHVASSGDPFFANEHHAPWFEGFIWIELLVQFPLSVYLVYKLASGKPTTPATELAGLAFGCVTCMGSVACCFELAAMGPKLVDPAKKPTLLYGTYLPFALIPGALALDMHQRLLARFNLIEQQDKAKKAQ